MINLRVHDCAGLAAALRAEGVAILGEADEGYGKFAWLLEPDGVKIECGSRSRTRCPETGAAALALICYLAINHFFVIPRSYESQG